MSEYLFTKNKINRSKLGALPNVLHQKLWRITNQEDGSKSNMMIEIISDHTDCLYLQINVDGKIHHIHNGLKEFVDAILDCSNYQIKTKK